MSDKQESSVESLYRHDIQSSESTKLGSSSDISQNTTLGDDKSSGRTPTPDLKGEKDISEYVTEKGIDEDVEEIPDDDPLLRDIPWQVRRVVSLEDDTTLSVFTFRYFFLTLLFIVPGAFLTQLDQYRTTFAPYSIFFVQIASNYVGDWMAKSLPAWEIRLPFTRRSFNLNPGPFSPKEHVMVTISASSGATYNLAFVPISMSELYFDNRINPGVCLFFMLAVVFIGYSYAAIARQFLVYDPQYPWYVTCFPERKTSY
jgi:hypothetical protein